LQDPTTTGGRVGALVVAQLHSNKDVVSLDVKQCDACRAHLTVILKNDHSGDFVRFESKKDTIEG
jgi:hypothetical protein